MSGSGIYLPMTSSNTAITPVPPTLQNFHILQPITTKPIKLTEDEDRIQGRVQGTVYRWENELFSLLTALVFMTWAPLADSIINNVH